MFGLSLAFNVFHAVQYWAHWDVYGWPSTTTKFEDIVNCPIVQLPGTLPTTTAATSTSPLSSSYSSPNNPNIESFPGSQSACPHISSTWKSRIVHSLSFAVPLHSPLTFDQEVPKHEASRRMLRLMKSKGRSYIAYDGNGSASIRGLVARLQFSRLLDKYPNLPDFDLVINTHDWPACFKTFHKTPESRFPAFSYSAITGSTNSDQRAACQDVVFPDFTENGWPESVRPSEKTKSYLLLKSTWRQDMQAMAQSRPFHSRNATLVFRGSRQTYGFARTKYAESMASRQWNVPKSLVDVQLDADYMSIFDMSKLCVSFFLLFLTKKH